MERSALVIEKVQDLQYAAEFWEQCVVTHEAMTSIYTGTVWSSVTFKGIYTYDKILLLKVHFEW